MSLTRSEIEELFERSKNDRAIIVGSEVRQLCGMALRALESETQPVTPLMPDRQVRELAHEMFGIDFSFHPDLMKFVRAVRGQS